MNAKKTRPRWGHPAWVEKVALENGQQAVRRAFSHRAFALEAGAKKLPRALAMLRKGDAVLARIAKSPTKIGTDALASTADDLFREAWELARPARYAVHKPKLADHQRAVANLRHLYAELLRPGWTAAKIREIARGLLGPAIEILEHSRR